MYPRKSNSPSGTLQMRVFSSLTVSFSLPTGLRKRGYAVARERSEAGESVYRISGAPDGRGGRVAVQTEAVDGRRDPKPKTKRAA